MTPEACPNRLKQIFDGDSFVKEVDRGQMSSISLKKWNTRPLTSSNFFKITVVVIFLFEPNAAGLWGHFKMLFIKIIAL